MDFYVIVAIAALDSSSIGPIFFRALSLISSVTMQVPQKPRKSVELLGVGTGVADVAYESLGQGCPVKRRTVFIGLARRKEQCSWIDTIASSV